MAHPLHPQDPFAEPPIRNMDGSWMFTARVARVVDGDSVHVWVLTDKGFGRMSADPEYIRLARVDAPEKNRASTAEAGRASWVWAQQEFPPGEPVYLSTRYDKTLGRLVGEVIRAVDGMNWSDSIVEAGHAIYKEY